MVASGLLSLGRDRYREAKDGATRPIRARPKPATGKVHAQNVKPPRVLDGYRLFFNGFASSRAPAMKSCASGLRVRFFSVMIAVG